MECLDVIGWTHATDILPTVVRGLVSAEGREESNAWRHPVDLVPLLENAFAGLPNAIGKGRENWGHGRSHRALAEEMLADDADAIIGAVSEALPTAPRQRTSAEHWPMPRHSDSPASAPPTNILTGNSAHHSFTYCNALDALLARAQDAESGRRTGSRSGYVARCLSRRHALYVNRFLNVPPAQLPGARNGMLDDLPEDANGLCQLLLEVMDRQSQVDGRGTNCCPVP